MKKQIIIVGLVSLTFLFSCGGPTTEVDPNLNKTDSNAIEDAASSQKRYNQLVDKFNNYIGFYNNFLLKVNDGMDSYNKWAGYDSLIDKSSKGYKSAPSVYGDYTFKKVEEALKSEPKMDVDEVASKLLPICKELFQVAKDAKSYYQKQNYKDDDFTKGQEFHSKLGNLVPEIYTLRGEFITKLEGIKEEIDKMDRAYFEKEGMTISVAKMDLMNAGEELISITDTLYIDNMMNLDLALFKQKFDVFKKAAEKFEEGTKNEEQFKKEFRSSSATSFINTVNNVVASGRALAEAVENKKTPESILNADMVNGTPEYFLKKYNTFVTTSNSLR